MKLPERIRPPLVGQAFESSTNLRAEQGIFHPSFRFIYIKLGRHYVIITGKYNGHIHGNTLNFNGHNMDEFSLLPGIVKTGVLSNDNPGKWLLHCHVNDHLDGGMVGVYNVIGDETSYYVSGHIVMGG